MKLINREKLAAAIEARAKSDLELCNIGGASVLVEQDGEIIYKKHFGSADMQGKTLSDDTLFRLASMTKPITAVAAMILVDRGLLSLEDRIEKFYPQFSSMNIYGSGEVNPVKITVKHLLTHSSGIGSSAAWIASEKIMTPADIESVESFIEFLSKQPLSFIPGTKREYSGVGAFSVLTGIIQKISGMSFSEFLQKEIFEPCTMKDTTFEPSPEQWSRLITMHNKRKGQNTVGATSEGCVFGRYPTNNYLGGAGLISSIGDYLNFARMLMNGGEIFGKRIISESALAELSKPQAPSNIREWWGLGVRVITDENVNPLPNGTFGWSGAYGTHFWVDRRNKIIGIYMKNSRYDGGSGAITSKNFETDVYSSIENA